MPTAQCCATLCKCHVLQCVLVSCSEFHCVASSCIVLPRAAVCCSALQCVAACCSVLQQGFAVCCSVLQRVAACCSVLQYHRVIPWRFQYLETPWTNGIREETQAATSVRSRSCASSILLLPVLNATPGLDDDDCFYYYK